MHPELLRLANARHDDLIRERQSRARPRAGPDDHPPRVHRARRRAGSLLIWAGTRLIADRRAGSGLELTRQ
jgi:hypothetical protein